MISKWAWGFVAAALFDLSIGIAFFFWGEPLLVWSAIPPPPEPVYIHLPAAYVLVQAASYALVAADLEKFRPIAITGLFWKVAYLSVLAVCIFLGKYPPLFMWIGVADIGFLVFFAAFLWRGQSPTASLVNSQGSP